MLCLIMLLKCKDTLILPKHNLNQLNPDLSDLAQPGLTGFIQSKQNAVVRALLT